MVIFFVLNFAIEIPFLFQVFNTDRDNMQDVTFEILAAGSTLSIWITLSGLCQHFTHETKILSVQNRNW